MFRNGKEDENARGASGRCTFGRTTKAAMNNRKVNPCFFLHPIIKYGAPVDLKCVAK